MIAARRFGWAAVSSVLSACAPTAAGHARAAAAASQCAAFVDVTVVPMDREARLPHQTVLVEGDTIAAVGPADRTPAPEGCTLIDGQHRYLIPGLMDTHVHFFGYRKPAKLDRAYEQRIATMLLANGVTTALVMEGTPELLALRDTVERGQVLAPKLFVAGALIQMDDLGLPAGRHVFASPAAVRDEVIAEKRAGYDFVKVHGDMTPEGYATLLATARAEGMRVVGHAPPDLGLDATLAGGQALITHAESYLDAYFRWNRPLPTDPAEVDRMVSEAVAKTAASGVWVQPTLSVFHQIAEQVADFDAFTQRPAMKYMPPTALAGWLPPDNPYLRHWKLEDVPGLRAQYELLRRLVRALDAAGVPMLAGTDDLVPVQLPGFSLKNELEELVASGLTTYGALRAATASSARFLGLRDRGTIATGKVADVVLVDADPLDDVDSAFRICGVMLRGRWLPIDGLMKALAGP